MTIRIFLTKAKFLHLYHWTDARNLPSIRLHGLLSLRDLNARGICPEAPGSNSFSRYLDAHSPLGLDRYVHLCLTNDHPMAYSATQDGRVSEVKYISVDNRVLETDGTLFCNDVANKTGVIPIPLEEAIVGPDLPFWAQWNDYNDATVRETLKRAKRFEVLVPCHIEQSMLGEL